MPNQMQVALVLKAIDQLSAPVAAATTKTLKALDAISKKSREMSESLGASGRALLLHGGIAAAALAGPVMAFADLEDASTRLRATLLKNSGEVSKEFGEINALAVTLGSQLPGTTADFATMFSTLLSLGVKERDLLSGVGEAAADLAVVLKIPYEQAAAATAKLKEATGVANHDMLAFMDTIQRTAFLGVEVGDLQYAFSRAAGGLIPMKVQGLAASKEVATLLAMLIKTGLSGEMAGTNLARLMQTLADTKKLGKANAALSRYGISLEMFDRRTGEFKGVRNMVAQLDQLRTLNPSQQQQVLADLFGGGADMTEAAIFINKGLAGFQEMQRRMEEQASLQQRTALLMGTLRNLWDATAGTITNVTASFAATFAPEMKQVTAWLGSLAGRADAFINRYPMLGKMVGLMAGGFALGAIGAGGLALALSGVLKYVSLVSGAVGTVHGWLQRLAVVSAADRLRYLGIAPQAGTLWSGIGQRIGVTYGQLTRWTTETWASARATIFNLAWLRLQAQTYGSLTWSGLVRATTAAQAWTLAQWTSARATLFNVAWLKAQAMTLQTTVWRSTVAATMATWGFVAAQWASLSASIAAAGGVRALTLAMLSNPVTAWLVGLTAAALAVYKFWAPIAGFFRGLVRGIGEGWVEVAQRSLLLRAIGTVVWGILTPLRWLYNLIVWIVQPVEDVGRAWESTGARIGHVIGKTIAVIADLPAVLFDLIRSTEWFQAGAKIMEQVWAGITAWAHKPVQAMRDVVQSIRNLLPFSPAKEGPLKTLHQVRLVQTIAESVQPHPLVQRVTQVVEATKQALTPILAPIALSSAPTGRGNHDVGVRALALAGAGGMGPMAFHFNFTINGAETGSEGGTKALAQRVAKETSLEFEKVMRRKYAI